MIKRFLGLVFALWTLSPCVLGVKTGSRPMAEPPSHNMPDFIDVLEGPYKTAIYWARDQGITTGTDAVHFNPSGICTRAHIITFLWRYDGIANGPAMLSGEQPFADIPVGCYYDKAAHWAYNLDIEPGSYSSGYGWLFRGDLFCSRLSAVTYLWKLAGRPTQYMYDSDVFDDVVQAPAEVRQAVGWAVHNGITKGTSPKTFQPEAVCTRAQISTFLYRYASGVDD